MPRPAISPATWVPCPELVSLLGTPSIGGRGPSLPSGLIFRLAFMAGARSGWVKSTPLSTIATVTPFPVTPRLGTGRAAPNLSVGISLGTGTGDGSAVRVMAVAVTAWSP